MNWLIAIAGTLNFYLGLSVLLKIKKGDNKKGDKISNLYFAFFTLLTSIVCIFDFIFRYIPTQDIVKWSYAFAALLPAAAILWIDKLCKIKFSPFYKFLIIFPALTLFFLSVTTKLIIEEVHHITFLGYKGETGMLFPYYTNYVSIMIVITIFILYRQIKKASSYKKNQLKYILLGIITYSFSATYFSLILPTFFEYYGLTLLDAPSSLFFVGFSTYSIVKHRLMGIKFIINRIVLHFIIAIFSYIFFYIVILIETNLWGSVYDINSLVVGTIIAIIYSAILIPLIRITEKTGDHFLFRGVNPRKRIKKILIKLNNAIELGDIYKILTFEFNKILGIEKKNVSLMIFEKYSKKNGVKLLDKACLNKKNITTNSSLILKEILKKKTNLVAEELNSEYDKSLIQELKSINAKIILPLQVRTKLLGIIILGPKKNHEALSKEDFEFLEIVKAQAASSIDNALLYRKVKRFNQTLQKKVNQQTQKLINQNKHLEQLLQIRGDFLNIASHQLRTPVTVIKGMSDMLLKGRVPKNKREEFLEGISSKAQKLSEIIHDILSASEMDNQEFKIKLEPLNITAMVKKVMEDKKDNIIGKNLKLIPKLPSKNLYALANDRFLYQAIGNLINNAIRYTPAKGKITVELKEEKENLLIKITDTGIGIPKEEIPKLFDKFVRAPNAVKHYTDGSGLGLFIVKRIIDAHQGAKVFIEKSTPGKGTTVTINLPKVEKKTN
ncbi:MAG: hypothetical protein GF347_05440 [Candidatus Moranbacteria bacterium]|nr:hypothetical protein [Candidatus Moranbacteria bacterium]